MKFNKATAITLTVGLILGIGIGRFFISGRPAPEHQAHADHAQPVETGKEAKPQLWTCSMHPQIILPKPGKCPICGMDLIPLESSSEDDAGGLRELSR